MSAAALLLAMLALPAAAAEVRLDHAWYRVELIVFEQPYSAPAPTDPLTDGASAAAPALPTEVLERTEPRHFPARVLAFDDGAGRMAYYPLTAETLATPAVPAVDLAYLAAIGVDTRPTRPALSFPEATDAIDSTAPVATPAVAPPPTPAEALAAATVRFEEDLLARSYRWLDPADLTLGNEARRLARAGGYRVLHHGAWIQPVPPRERPEPLLLQVGDRTRDVHTVEGTLAVTLARYLHVEAQLWHPVDTETASGGAGPAPYFELAEQRRLRTGELHFLDHPRFGLLLRVDPVELPEDLRALAADTP